jgi:hypothetical protein
VLSYDGTSVSITVHGIRARFPSFDQFIIRFLSLKPPSPFTRNFHRVGALPAGNLENYTKCLAAADRIDSASGEQPNVYARTILKHVHTSTTHAARL